MGGKYQSYTREPGISREERKRIHPIWRGVGFAMIVLFPIIAYAGMKILLSQPWFPLPLDLFARPGQIIYRLFPDPLIYIKAITMGLIILVLLAIFTFFSFLMNSAFGMNNRKDPFYVPPVKRQRRRR
ncbi:MAG: hypothetical protein IH586_15055 [Anaerolineaceae bacterium]|nr:hypothetical protein [Anaerolineaceae bacterium]